MDNPIFKDEPVSVLFEDRPDYTEQLLTTPTTNTEDKTMKTFTIGIPWHSYVTVEIKAKTPEEAFEKASEYEPSDEEILANLVQDGAMDLVEVKEG